VQVVAGLAGAGLAGGLMAWAAHRRRQQGGGPAGTESGTEDCLLAEPPPHFAPARTVTNPADRTGLKITLFQYQTCPFCCKARVFLDYFGLSYDVVEVNSVLRQQVEGGAQCGATWQTGEVESVQEGADPGGAGGGPGAPGQRQHRHRVGALLSAGG
jgi:hypothetical protein